MKKITLLICMALSFGACKKSQQYNRFTDSVKKYNKLAVKSDSLALAYAADHKYPDMLKHFDQGEEYRKRAQVFQDSLLKE